MNFIEEIVSADVKSGIVPAFRFPPEPNGFLHIGHAVSICLNFGLREKFGGTVNLRMDDTNPETESEDYVDAIKQDIEWLGFRWDLLTFASDNFGSLASMADRLIEMGLAYADDSTPDEISSMRGTPTTPGTESRFRARGVEENRLLFMEMLSGGCSDGSRTLRAKIDMSSPNMHMRDPVIYRVRSTPHHRTGTRWGAYPTYDFAHGQCDAIEGITHSLCTMEFESHRQLYDWFIEKLGLHRSRQYEFARRNLGYSVTSKRKLLSLIDRGIVSGWDDPRMPTISGMRRRGYPAESIRDFCARVGIARRENVMDFALLEFCVRERLNKTAQRRMVVSDPIRMVITNYSGRETVVTENNPEDPAQGERSIAFSGNLFIERSDFSADPPPGFRRLRVGGVVRLKSAYVVRCDSFESDATGKVTAVMCTYFPETKSGSKPISEKNPKVTIHFIDAETAVPIEVREYGKLYLSEDASDESINPESMRSYTALAEPSLALCDPDDVFQFVRSGYFVKDKDGHFNRTVTLRD